eukprot:Nk52_evm25s212 gene=Nk52_evmTU25s212
MTKLVSFAKEAEVKEKGGRDIIVPVVPVVENRNENERRASAVAAVSGRFKHHDYYTQMSRVKDPMEVVHMLESSPRGLRVSEARRRLVRDGKNEMPSGQYQLLWQVYHALVNPFNILLLGLALFTYFTGDGKTDSVNALIMLMMIVVSFTVTFVQEYRSNNATEKLKKMITRTVLVLRRDDEEKEEEEDDMGEYGPCKERKIPIADLVVGDVILMSAGDVIPADVYLLEAKELSVSQSALTGESMPVEKYANMPSSGRVNTASSSASASDSENDECDQLLPYGKLSSSTVSLESHESSTLFDSPSLCFMGTNVVSGSAAGVVLKTGADVYLGTIAKTIVGKATMSSFDYDIRRYVYFMSIVIIIMAPLVFVINYLTKGSASDSLLFAVSVAVGLVPEMLPMIVAVNLAKGASVMATKKVVIKRLNVVQNLGAMDVLCTDKTGTLTDDNISVSGFYGPDGRESYQCLKYSFLNSHLQTGLRNVIDNAVNVYCTQSWGQAHVDEILSEYAKVDELPFDFVRKRMSVVVEEISKFNKIEHNPVTLVCKGAAEEVVNLCSSVVSDEDPSVVVPLNDTLRARILDIGGSMNAQGLRMVAVATRNYLMRPEKYEEKEMIFQGFLAFLDPPKESAAEAVELITNAGVAVKVLTGDNEAVAVTVCKKVGIAVDEILLGSTVDALSDEELREAAERVQLFAKLSPIQKSRIVQQLQAAGHIVGFLGDGINDAPALKHADAGISVDNGADISKEAAEIILMEKNLMVLYDGIVEGRKVFANILKYIKMGISSNFGNVFSMIGASAMLPFLPMSPIMLLTLNLLYDISQIAIPWDNVDVEFLAQPHRWNIVRDIGRFMVCIGPISSIFDYATFGLMWYYFNATDANNGHDVSLFQTGWFCESLLTQTLIVHIIRTHKMPVFQSRCSWSLGLLTTVIIGIGMALPYTPVGDVLDMVSLPGMYYVFLLLFITCYVVMTQMVKHFYVQKWGIY